MKNIREVPMCAIQLSGVLGAIRVGEKILSDLTVSDESADFANLRFALANAHVCALRILLDIGIRQDLIDVPEHDETESSEPHLINQARG